VKIEVYAPPDAARPAARIAHSVLSESLGDATARVVSGRALLTATLFYNDHLEVAHKLLELIRQASEAGVRLKYVERNDTDPLDAGTLLDEAVLSEVLHESLTQYR
jgi:hypothetical protein